MEFITSENILLLDSAILIAGVLIGKCSYRIGLLLLASRMAPRATISA